MCINYHELNRLTIKNWYPLPLISRLLDQVSRTKVYTKIYLHGAYNLVHIKKVTNGRLHFVHAMAILSML